MDTTTDRSALEGKLIPELQQIAQRLGIEGSQKLRKAGLIDAIVEHAGGDGSPSNGPAAPANTSDGGTTAMSETSPDERAPRADGGSNGNANANAGRHGANGTANGAATGSAVASVNQSLGWRVFGSSATTAFAYPPAVV